MIYDEAATEDIKKVLHYIVDDYIEYDDGDYSPKGYCCLHCYKSHGFNSDKNNIPHAADCPYLIAKDLLTREE